MTASLARLAGWDFRPRTQGHVAGELATPSQGEAVRFLETMESTA